MELVMGTDVTRRLLESRLAGQEALDEPVPLIYEELRRLARDRMRRERPDHTLTTTALVHEAYLKLVDVNRVEWQDRAHFFAMASRVMRRVLVDYARRWKAAKRGGGQRVELDEARLVPDAYAEQVLELHDALDRLEDMHPRQREIVEQRYFGGPTLEETGAVLGVSLTTVKRELLEIQRAVDRPPRRWLLRVAALLLGCGGEAPLRSMLERSIARRMMGRPTAVAYSIP
jgi:RNA polymerase sigma factor (TIGR02999 family)